MYSNYPVMQNNDVYVFNFCNISLTIDMATCMSLKSELNKPFLQLWYMFMTMLQYIMYFKVHNMIKMQCFKGIFQY